MDVKNPITFEEQLQKIKDRGCIVEDEKRAIEILKQINYYRLTAYFLAFKKDDNTYFEGTTFENVYHIYEFDRKLRNILFSALEEIEILMRTQLSYFFSHKYGALGYTDENNFGKGFNKKEFDILVRCLVKQNQSKPFVKHHIENYNGKFPMWVLVEIMSFGNLSIFYANMKRSDKKELARTAFAQYDKNIESWLVCMTDLRNACAHYARLYNTRMTAEPRTPNGHERKFGKTIFDYIQVLKMLYPDKDKWNNIVMSRLISLVIEYNEYIALEHIGFPENWKTELWNQS